VPRRRPPSPPIKVTIRPPREPEVWGVNSEQLHLPTARDVAVTPKGLRRRDAFDALAGSLTTWQRLAADRLVQDLAELYGVAGSFGVGRTDPAYSKGAARLLSLRRMRAREELKDAFSRIGLADQVLLQALAEPIVLGRASCTWRDLVRRVTGETLPQPQAARVRSALENLRLAYGLGPRPALHPFGGDAPKQLVRRDPMLASESQVHEVRPDHTPRDREPRPPKDRGSVISGDDMDQAAGRYVLQRVLVFTQVSASAFGDKGKRSAPVSYARALAAYLMHVELGYGQQDCAGILPMTQQAVSEAVERIEELREEPALDTAIDILAEDIRRRFSAPPRAANDN
jgi:hypothetical protein